GSGGGSRSRPRGGSARFRPSESLAWTTGTGMTRSYTIPRNFRRVVRRIQRHGTYSCCQLSYDVGQRASIAGRHRAWNDLSTFILYAKWKTPFTRDEGASIDAPIPRE